MQLGRENNHVDFRDSPQTRSTFTHFCSKKYQKISKQYMVLVLLGLSKYDIHTDLQTTLSQQTLSNSGLIWLKEAVGKLGHNF